MKTLRNISVILLLFHILFSYVGHDIVDHYGHIMHRIEHATPDKSHRSMAQEPMFEDDAPIVSSRDHLQTGKDRNDGFAAHFCIFPPKLCYTIWLPPELA